MKAWRGSKVWLHSFLTSALDGVHPSAALHPGKYRASIEKVAGRTLEPVWMFWRKVSPVGIRKNMKIILKEALMV